MQFRQYSIDHPLLRYALANLGRDYCAKEQLMLVQWLVMRMAGGILKSKCWIDLKTILRKTGTVQRTRYSVAFHWAHVHCTYFSHLRLRMAPLRNWTGSHNCYGCWNTKQPCTRSQFSVITYTLMLGWLWMFLFLHHVESVPCSCHNLLEQELMETDLVFWKNMLNKTNLQNIIWT